MPSSLSGSPTGSASTGGWSFLVDENLPRLLAPRLRTSGYQAEDVRDVGLGAHPDADVWRYAQAQARTLITQDGERLARRLGFTEIMHGKGPLGDDRCAFRLDLDERKPTAQLAIRYQAVLRNRNRRAKRHRVEKMSA